MRAAARLSLAALALSVLLPLVRPRPFFSPDEAFYAEVAREMSETGDFVVPRFDGAPWLEKPPLFYWLLAAAFGLAGWGFPAAALLNGLVTLLTAGLVALHVARDAGAVAAALAFGFYVTMLGPALAAGTALTDPLLTLCTTAAIVAFLHGGRGSAALAGVCLGLGVLTKGPIAPLVVIPAFALAPSPTHSKLRRLLVALAFAVLVAAPWHVLLALRGLWPEYEAVFLQQHVFSRALIPGAQSGPWWFYLPVLALVAFPWATPALLGLRRWRTDVPRSEAAAIVAPLVALSFSTTKLAHYLLPVLPWLAAILGRSTAARWAGWEPPGRRVLAALGGLFAAGAIGFLVYAADEPPFHGLVPTAMRFALGGMALLSVLLGWLEVRQLTRLSWLGWATVALALRVLLFLWGLPYANGLLVEQPVVEAVRAEMPPRGFPVAHRYFRPYLVAYGLRAWRHSTEPVRLRAELESVSPDRSALVLTPAPFEGEVLAAARETGSTARELRRVRGLGLLGGSEIELALFRIDHGTDPARWFADLVELGPADTGFSYLERSPWADSYRWTTERIARLTIPASPGGPATLRLRAWGYPQALTPQSLTVRLNGHALVELGLPRQPAILAFPVPASALRADLQELDLEVSSLLVPAQLRRISTDRRALGLALDWLALDPAPQR